MTQKMCRKEGISMLGWGGNDIMKEYHGWVCG